ncbi:MAG: hypothetical protein HQK77_19130 [Desulfobacterales bacterium]|nr:hypothetical protein [Desulfobacterales bacterium]
MHTTCSDGELTVPQVIKVYERLGFDFIALTDHDYLIRPGCYTILEQIQTSMLVFTGVEKTVFQKGYVHVNEIHGIDDKLYIFNHPHEMGLPVNKAVQRIFEVHQQIQIDAIEITTRGFSTPEYDIPAIPFPKVATDDSHMLAGCGRAWVEMDVKRDKDSIIRAIRLGDFWNCFASS